MVAAQYQACLTTPSFLLMRHCIILIYDNNILSPQRPKSGKVRPLSSRVFIRRTSGKGWVAKAYPDILDEHDLDIQDDLSDCDSLDSFFDDDFDTEQQGEKLQNLLTCNTLKVESKVNDYNIITVLQ